MPTTRSRTCTNLPASRLPRELARALALSAALLVAVSAAAQDQTVVLRAAQDAMLNADWPDQNTGASDFAAKIASMKATDYTRIMLVQFDTSALASSTVTRATLRLFCPPSGWDHSIDARFAFFAVRQPWAEGSGVDTEGSETRDGATWNTRDGLHPWDGGAIAQHRVANSPGNFADAPFATLNHSTYEEWLNTWIEVDATELVRQWVGGAVPNHGIAVCALGLSTNNAYTMFATREFGRDGCTVGQGAAQLVVRLAAPPAPPRP